MCDREVYDTINPGWTGRCTAPLLVDKKTKKIISNESSDIGRTMPCRRRGVLLTQLCNIYEKIKRSLAVLEKSS